MARQFSEAPSALKGVEIFECGRRRGKSYTEKDLDDISRNFERFSSPRAPRRLLKVPAVLGHEEDQKLLDDSSLPAAGWPTRVYRDGRKLKADFDRIPPRVGRLLRNGAYATVSAEIYDEGGGPEGVPVRGKALRRIAFLGGELPQVKTLQEWGDLTDHAEGGDVAYRRMTISRVREARRGPDGKFWTSFAEVRPMAPADMADTDTGADREALVDRLAKEGLDAETIAAGVKPGPEGDALLAEMCRMVDEKSQTPAEEPEPEEPAEGGEPPMPAATMADEPMKPEKPGPDADDAQYAEYGRKMSEYEEHCASRMAEEEDEDKEKMAESEDGDKPTGGMGGTSSGSMGEGDEVSTQTAPMVKKRQVTEHFSEADRRTIKLIKHVLSTEVNGHLARLNKFQESREATDRKRDVEAFIRLHSFCEGDPRTKQVRIQPWELDGDNPANLRDQLMRADATRVVRKFKEGKRDVALTELDLQKKSIELRPPINFAEQRMPKSGTPGVSKPTDRSQKNGKAADVNLDDDIGQIQPTFEKFSESVRGLDVETLINGYKAEKRHNPKLTPEDYLEDLKG